MSTNEWDSKIKTGSVKSEESDERECGLEVEGEREV